MKGSSTRVLVALAAEVGACVRPVLQRLTDTMTGETRIVSIPCGATLASSCPSCAERNRKLRMQQCREGWHLADDPLPDPDDDQDDDDQDDDDQDDDDQDDDDQDDDDQDDDDQDDDDQDDEAGRDDESSRRVRSTRRRQDAPPLERLPIAARTVGQTFQAADGKKYRPSMFLTVTMPSYGQVREDGTPVDFATYDYRGAALDALHMPKVFDRLVQNMRRAAGYRLQYFAAVEPQKRLAPHVHAAIRGAIPRRIVRKVLAATYHQLWWPAHDQPIYTDPATLPVWRTDADGQGRYVDAQTGDPLPTWDDALDAIDADPDARPVHVIRFGTQHELQGIIAGPKADRRVGYLTKYLTKSIADGAAPDGELTERQKEHARRLHEHVRSLPCSPECANWLRFGITPADPSPGMAPGHCPKKAHRPDRLGCGGRRVLVSRYWTGKTLSEHAADRLGAVRVVLEAAGIELPDGCSATELRPDGQPRWRWDPVSPKDTDAPTYRRALTESIDQRLAWREQYEHARDGSGPPDITSHSATASTPEGAVT